VKRIWVVSLVAQEENIKRYCSAECGKILIGGLDIGGGIFLLCKTDECDYVEKSLILGEFDLLEGKREIIVRKLLGVENESHTDLPRAVDHR
jgi:hypothetical protein